MGLFRDGNGELAGYGVMGRGWDHWGMVVGDEKRRWGPGMGMGEWRCGYKYRAWGERMVVGCGWRWW